VADWKAAETTRRLLVKAEELQKRLADGTPLDTLATELGVEKQTKRGLRREADDGDFGKAGVAELFSVPEGGSGLIEAPTGDAQLLYKVTEVFEPAGADAGSIPEDARKSFASGMADDLLDQLVARLQSEYEVSINRNAMTQALAF
jgi:peptidyl-prolyl cis-trans isomerase D